MAKQCWFCGKKTTIMNEVLFYDRTICTECRDLFDRILLSKTKTELETTSSILIARIVDNDEAEQFIRTTVQKRSTEIVSVSEQEIEDQKRLEEKKKEAEKAFLKEQEQKEQKKTDAFLKENGHEGYYEYRVLNIVDERTGCVNISEISNQLNTLGRQGWHLSCAYTNEIGKNTTSVGFGGVASGVNSTVEQSILILERFIKFK